MIMILEFVKSTSRALGVMALGTIAIFALGFIAMSPLFAIAFIAESSLEMYSWQKIGCVAWVFLWLILAAQMFRDPT